tara:strand:- start:35 stop:529 length:495 start_codon:yes stop_codon:yes gene_type:complete
MAKHQNTNQNLIAAPTSMEIGGGVAQQSGGDSRSIVLIRQAFDKEKFTETINTNFTQLGVNEQDLTFFDPNLATVGDFFSIYNTLFFLIPKTGPNSHTTLIEDSSQYVDYKANQVEIQALLDEIAELREQNLQLTLDVGNVLRSKKDIDGLLRDAGLEEDRNNQ